MILSLASGTLFFLIMYSFQQSDKMLKLLAITFFGVALLIAIGMLFKNMFHKRQSSLYSDADIEALASLRSLAGSELKDDYMKEDYYLARFLSPIPKHLRVQVALEDLLKHLQWRDKHNISTILQEDWSDMQTKFPVTSGTFDLKGRPIFYFDVGQYNVVNFLPEGGSAKRFLRYIIKVLEESDVRVRQLRSQGKDVSQYIWILNLADYNITRHACVQCILLYHSVSKTLIKNYPFVNQLLLHIGHFLPPIASCPIVLNDVTHETIIFFEQDRDKWQSILKRFVHPDQFPAGLKQRIKLTST